ncbi:MAG: PKD domain-containing protein [Ferruginibacter sp.]
MRKFILAALALAISFTALSQDFSNKGKEFWLAYSYHVGMVNTGGAPVMTLYLTSDVSTTFSVDIYNVGTLQTGTILPNQVVSVVIPNSYFINADGLFTNKAIHVTAAKPIVVYSFITRSQASAATLCLPTNVLGKEYYGMSFTQNSNEANACSYITIVAVEDNTTVEIIPKAATKGGWAANTQHNITLNKGEVYQVLGTTSGNNGVDLSGTSVKAIASGIDGCKRIAVFSGSGKLALGCAGGSADNLYQQLYPATSWGRKYLTIPSYNRPYTFYRVIKNDPATNVYVNGTLINPALFTNGYYQFNTSTGNLVEADQPISVTQYFTSQGCLGNGSPYDPDMVVLNPVEQNISKVTLISTPLTAAGAQEHHLHVIMKNSGTGISSFKFDGNPVSAASWVVHPQDINYSYLYIPNVSVTSHTLVSDSGFNALAYGYGNAETYAYSAGTNVRDLYQQIGVTSQYGIETTPSVCTGSPFRFKVSLPYLADSLYWDLSGLPAPTPPNVLLHYPPTLIDSTTNVNGKTIYWYSLPTPYTINTVGTYPISITAYSPTAIGGCGTTQDIDFDLEVSSPPIANFTYTSNGCVGSPVQFNDATITTKPTYKWDWDFDDPASGSNNKSALKNPTHIFAQAGTYVIKFSTITTPGCLSDTTNLTTTNSTLTVTITDKPVANFTRSNPVCEGMPITFTDLSTASAPGTLTKWYWDFGDGNTTLATSAATASQVHTYNNWTPTLTSSLTVETNSGCQSLILTNSFKVNPVPFVDFNLPGGVCLPTGNTPFSSTSVLADGSIGTATYLWNFGDPASGTNNTSAINPTTHAFTSAPPPGPPPGFPIKLTVTSAAGCSHDSTKYLNTVYPQPHGAYTAPAPVCAGTAMNFTSTSDPLAGNTIITYYWNFGDATGIISSATNTISHTYASNGTFTVLHWIVTDKGCNSDTASHTVTSTAIPVISSIVHANPTTCTGSDGTITLSGLIAGSSYTVNFDKNGTPQTASTIVAGATGTVIINALTAGTYSNINVTLLSCTSSNAATQILTDPAPPAPPTVTGTSLLCSGSTITLNASTAVAGTISYAWTGPGGFNSNIQNPSITNATVGASGSYYATITVNNCTSAQSTAFVVTVNATPVVSSVVPSNPTTCGGTDGSITLNGLTPGLTYTVNYQKNSIAQTPLSLTASASGTIVITTLASGTYSNINCTNSGCTSVNAANQILSDPSAPAAPSGSTSNSPVCAGGTLSFSTPAVSNAIYTWSGPGFTSSLQNPTIPNVTVGASGNYTISITVNNCVSAAFTLPLVTINALPVANFSNSTPTCETKTINFTDLSVPNSGIVNTWSWDFGDPSSGANNISALQNPAHTFASANATPYQIKLTVTTDKGCSSTQIQKPITVAVNPVAGFMIPEVCLNDVNALFTDTSKISTGTITGWAWNFGDPGPLNTSTAQNGSHKYTSTGSFSVTLTVTSNTGCINTLIQNIFINGATPTADFTVTNAAAICGSDSVSITNLSTVNPGNITKAEIYWDNLNFPLPAGPNYTLDDNPTLNKIYKHKYPALQTTKTYTIRFRAYSGTLCVNDKLVVITVNAVPKVQFNNIPDICYDAAPYQITQASEIGAVPGTATYSGPGVSATGLFTPVTAGVGTFTIKYTYTSTAGGCFDTLSKTIKVLDTASANFSVSAIRCEKKAITFTDNSTAPAGIITTWTWDFGDGSGPVVKTTANPFTHTYAATGTYNVTLKVVTSNGCKSTVRTIPVVVSPQPKPDFTMPVACLPNANVTFTNLSTIADASGMTYLWNFGDALSGSNTSTAVNGSHIFNNNGPFNISLLVTSNAGCDSTVTKPYSDLHPQPLADFTLADPTGVCLGTGTTFTDNSTGADGIVTNWIWDLGDGSASINQAGVSAPINHTYTDTLLYSIKLSITNSFGCKNDITKQFQVHAFPAVNAGPDRFVLEGGSITLQPVVTGNDLQYLWLPGTFMNDPTSSTPVISKVTNDISYTLTVTARGGCSASDIVFVKLLKFPVIPNTFTPNNDGINDFWSIDYLDTYPDNWVQVFNRYGQLVFESHGYAKPWDGTYKGKPLPIGTYYYIIEPKNGRAPLTGYVTIIK